MEWLSVRTVIPQRFLGDAILSACYLINRMSSSVLHDQIPHSVLLPNQPLFCFPPLVFGCVYFVHILTPGQDKLSVNATKCVFLGYSRLQRGYRCYSPDINRYFIYADVSFLENSSFFSFATVFLCRMSYHFLLSYHLQIYLLHLRMS